MKFRHIQNDPFLTFTMSVDSRLYLLHKYLPDILTTDQADSMYILVREIPPVDSDLNLLNPVYILIQQFFKVKFDVISCMYAQVCHGVAHFLIELLCSLLIFAWHVLCSDQPLLECTVLVTFGRGRAK
jgi:hypothetical protein